MKKASLIFVPLIILLLFSACKKEVTEFEVHASVEISNGNDQILEVKNGKESFSYAIENSGLGITEYFTVEEGKTIEWVIDCKDCPAAPLNKSLSIRVINEDLGFNLWVRNLGFYNKIYYQYTYLP